jgi:methionyl-tRNA formyltransferase
VVSVRIAYFGTPRFAVPALETLLRSNHDVAVVVSQPDRPHGRGLKLQPTPTKIVAQLHDVPVLQPPRVKDESFLSTLAAFSPDIGVVAAYGRILPDALLAIPRMGLINIHASLLPKYRGAAPVHRAVIDGERTTGVSIMQIVSELDAGPVYRTAERTIGRDETTPEVENGLAALGATLVTAVLDDMAAGKAVAVTQDHSRATYAGKIERHEGAIDWNQPALRIHDLVRGLQPWPLVSAVIDGQRYQIHRTELTERAATGPGGTVLQADKGELVVAAGDGRAIRILVIQPAGKRPMSAKEFLAGHRIRAGILLTPA